MYIVRHQRYQRYLTRKNTPYGYSYYRLHDRGVLVTKCFPSVLKNKVLAFEAGVSGFGWEAISCLYCLRVINADRGGR